MKKIDYKKTSPEFYKPSAKNAAVVTVPPMNFLMLDGAGDPNTSQAFQDAIDVLFPVSYALKFMVKKGEVGVDYGVLPLEGLWWADDMSTFSVGKKSAWKWTLMIRQPEFIDVGMVEQAAAQVKSRKDPAALPLLRFEEFDEGESAQIMHVGPFSTEGPTIVKLHSFIEAEGRTRVGKHHEIYLSDIRRANPEKWKTVLRQPVK